MERKIRIGLLTIAAVVVIAVVFLAWPRSFDSLFDTKGYQLRVMKLSLDLSQPRDDHFYEQDEEHTEQIVRVLRQYKYRKVWIPDTEPYTEGALIFMIFHKDNDLATIQLVFDGKMLFCDQKNGEQSYRVSGGSELLDKLDRFVEAGTEPQTGSAFSSGDS